MAAKPEAPMQAREHLLATASRIMRENDTLDVSLSELSRQSGLNAALVKYYFGNKAGLMTALLERDMASILGVTDSLIADDRPPDVKLSEHIGWVVDKFLEQPYILGLLMRMIDESPAPEAQRLADKYLAPMYEASERLIAHGVESGAFRPVDPRMFFFTLTGAVDRFFAARMFMRYCFGEEGVSEELVERFRRHTVDFIMAGLRV